MRRILIIEDDAIIARVYGSKYSSAGFETSVAADGEVGLELLKTFKPDLVHLDLGVPKVNGAEIIRRIRSQAETKTLPIIILTNTYQNRLVKTAMEAGATECVSKATCTPKMMMEVVEKYRARMGETPAAPLALIATPHPDPQAGPPEASEASEAASTPPLSEAPAGSAFSETRETQRQASFQAEIQAGFAKRAPEMLATLRDRIEPLLRAETEAARIPELSEMHRIIRLFSGHAGIAGLKELAQMSSALEALLRELLERPKELTDSSLRTIVDACDFLDLLFKRSVDSAPESTEPSVVLVVDDDILCRRAACLALARINVATISVDDPQVALRLLAENRFSLILLDVEMPGLNGFDLCRELRTLPANQTTPVVFVTSLDGFQSRETALASGGNDLIAKPFLPMELAVKALSLLRESQISTQASA